MIDHIDIDMILCSNFSKPEENKVHIQLGVFFSKSVNRGLANQFSVPGLRDVDIYVKFHTNIYGKVLIGRVGRGLIDDGTCSNLTWQTMSFANLVHVELVMAQDDMIFFDHYCSTKTMEPLRSINELETGCLVDKPDDFFLFGELLDGQRNHYF